MIKNSLTRKLSLSLAALGVAVMGLAYTTGNVYATSSTTQINIPVDTVIRNVGVGNSKELASKSIADENQGMVCSVKAVAKNQGSVHPGNDLVVASGQTSVTLEDVERESGVDTTTNGELTLSDTVTVSLVMGQDNVFSAGMMVKLTCEEPEIEVCRDGEIITIKKSERLETDTAACKQPPKMIEVCRDGKIITINEDEKRDSDTATCPVVKEVKVCRDDKIITVSEDAVLDSDIEGSCPQTLGTTTELPKTGAGAIATSLLGVSKLLSGAYGFVKNRR